MQPFKFNAPSGKGTSQPALPSFLSGAILFLRPSSVLVGGSHEKCLFILVHLVIDEDVDVYGAHVLTRSKPHTEVGGFTSLHLQTRKRATHKPHAF